MALMAFANADDSVVAYDATLKCGQCVKGGYNFCFQGSDGDVIADGGEEPLSTCCEDNSCSEFTDDTYQCSMAYSDIAYALTFCPQKQAVCGEDQTVDYTDVGQETNLTITGMTAGETCTYTIKSSKGSPCFKVSNDSDITDAKVNITYIEYAEDKVHKTSESGSGSEESPSEGRPARNQSFEDSGNQGTENKGGQNKPARQKADGSKTTDEKVDDEKDYIKNKEEHDEEKADEDEGGFFKRPKDGDKDEDEDEEEGRPDRDPEREAEGDEDGEEKSDEDFGGKRKPAEDEREENTEAVEGYGKPTKGTYNSDDKGYKTFGTTGQGENKEGAKERNDSEDQERGMIVSVTAVADQGGDTILLETGNYDFLEEYVWDSAKRVQALTLAAVALVGASMF